MNREQYAELMRSTALQAGSRSVMAYLASQSSFFTLPIVNPVVGFFVSTIIRIALERGELALFFYYIDMRVSRQGREFEEAAVKNLEAQKNGTDEEKKIAEKNLVDKFRALTRFDS